MTHFKKIALISRLSSPKELEQIKKIISLLKEKYSSDVYINNEFAKHLSSEKSIKIEQVNKFDLIIAFGGD